MINRRQVLSLSAGAAIGGLLPVASVAPARAGGIGFSSDLADRLDMGYRSGLLRGLHAVRVMLNGQLALERYFSGPDEDWGRPLGQVTFTADTLHDLRSVSKSITSLLYGIALKQGKVPKPDQPVLAAFPEYADLANDPTRSGWKIQHLLDMTLGTDWNENLPYSNPQNSEIQMEQAADRYRFILSRDVVAPPGSTWNYNGGCTALLGRLIEQGTGQSLDRFAELALFTPLQIDDFDWNRGQDGAVSAASGLRLTAPALNRIGDMILARGKWLSQQVVPQGWLQACMKPATTTRFGQGYSQQWYLSRQQTSAMTARQSMLSGMGNGGQRLYVLPGLGLSIVVFAGNYNQQDQWMTPTLVLQRLILTALKAG